MNKNNWQDRAIHTDFDPNNQVQQRVLANIYAPKRTFLSWKRNLVWGMVGVFLLIVGAGLATVWNKQQCQLSAPTVVAQEITEENCAALNGRFLLAQAVSNIDEDCTCKKQSAFDEKTVRQISRQLGQVFAIPFTSAEKEQLKECNKKFKPQVHAVALCQTQC